MGRTSMQAPVHPDDRCTYCDQRKPVRTIIINQNSSAFGATPFQLLAWSIFFTGSETRRGKQRQYGT